MRINPYVTAVVGVILTVVSLTYLDSSKSTQPTLVGSRDTGILPVTDLTPKVVTPSKEEIRQQTKQALMSKLPKHYAHLDKKEAKKLVKLVYKEAGAKRIDPILVLGLIGAESNFKKDSVSPMGAKGYTQVMPEYHQDKINGRDLHHPAVNVQVGVRILHDCMRSRKSERMALACYNGARAKADIDRYVKAVYSHRNKIQRLAEL